MKTLKILSPQANHLRRMFQNLIVLPFIKSNGGIKGYKGQIWLLLPKFDRRTALCRGVEKTVYTELSTHLYVNQSQRRFNRYIFQNDLMIIKSFVEYDLSICYDRVWHNGTTVYTGKHWKAQALALRNNIDRFNFTCYENDYNFNSHHHEAIERADPFLVAIYESIIVKKLGSKILEVS